MTVARLIHINGLPGMGKTSLAEAYVGAVAGAVVVDIDELRTGLDRWHERPESRLEARELAVEVIGSHLGQGQDVVLPQFVGRLEFIEQLAAVAGGSGHRFVEVMLTPSVEVAEERFRRRRVALDGRPHPENDVADGEIGRTIADAAAVLAEVVRARPATIQVDASGTHEQVLSELMEAIEGTAASG